MYFFGGMVGWNYPYLSTKFYSQIYSLLVICLTVSVSDFTTVVATSPVEDKSTICQWADGSKAEVFWMEYDTMQLMLFSVSSLSFQILRVKIECQRKRNFWNYLLSDVIDRGDSLLLRIKSAKGLLILSITLPFRNKVFPQKAHSHPC